ncbi:efflux RND transporter periplasmic adaptor subunit [Sorangium sp. So ce119]|uniref:efflux RND transporter periplasmic adaptor subunit n=1 Tax=Sorangium sp. So ce119 TaxID=3133279 RepID=UPI003F627AA2
MKRTRSIVLTAAVALLGCNAPSTDDGHAAHAAPSAAPTPVDPHAGHGAQRAEPAGGDPHAGHGAQRAEPAGGDPHAGHRAPAAQPAGGDPHAGHGAPAAQPAAARAGEGAATPMSPAGYAPVSLDPARLGGLALSTAVVESRELKRPLRTVGVVALDETRSAHVHAKVRGFVERVAVDFVGRKVSAGQALCSLYSQEVFAAELEFVALLERAAGAPAPAGELAAAERRAHEQLLAAARRRLSLWDVPKAEIARLEATRQPQRTFALTAPRAGVVVAKQAVDGMFVEPSLELYTISDLSRVWVLADVYERDVPHVRAGDHAHLHVEGREGALHAPVAFVPPTVDEATRTMKIRFELDNADGSLRPGAFVSVTMDLALGEGLSVPESAVIRTGTRAIAFVVQGDRAEPREVKLGPLVGDRYRVDAGLSAGERVATGAQFLLDSESRLQASSAPKGGHVH